MTAEPVVILDGIVFPEGPRWRDGRLFFSDMHAHRVMSVTPRGKAEIVQECGTMRPSGIGWLADGRMIVVDMAGRKLVRVDGDRLVDHADLAPFAVDDCNDMVVDRRGRAYVGCVTRKRDADGRQLTTNIILAEPDGTVRLAASGLRFPNGSAISADGKTFIVAETFARRLTAFDIAADGTLGNRREFASVHPATPDGICLDAEGAAWVASPTTAEFLRVREGGEVVERILTPGRMAIACMLGGSDRRTLFLLTAVGTLEDINAGKTRGAIEAVGVEVAGAGWP